MFCSKCGSQLQSDVAFCSKCGNPVASTSTPQHVAAPPTPQKAKKSSKVSTVLTYVAGGFVVLVFGSAIIGMMGNGGEVESNQSSSTSTSDPNASNETNTEANNEDLSNENSNESSGDVPGYGQGARTESGVEVYAISSDTSPSIPNQFVIDKDDVKGQLVSMRFTILNDSNEEISISTGSFYGYIGSAEYEPVAVFSSDGEWYLYEPLGAGLETTVDVYFDIPAGKSISGAKYQTSMFLGEEIEFRF